jgi:hypothetical protein
VTQTSFFSGRITLTILDQEGDPQTADAADVWFQGGWLVYRPHGVGEGEFVAIPSHRIVRVETAQTGR